MVTMRALRSLAMAGVVAVAVSFAAAAPAGAQQVVDAGGDNGQGGLAFVLMALMVFAIGFALVFMDRVRRRRESQTDKQG
jgi:hypothetical protein